jgi:hypothetical protein
MVVYACLMAHYTKTIPKIFINIAICRKSVELPFCGQKMNKMFSVKILQQTRKLGTM